MDIVRVAIIGRADGDDGLEGGRAARRNLKSIEPAPGDSHHPDDAAAPRLRGQPRDHLDAIVLLLLCVLVEQQATRLAATSDIDANAGVAVAGQIRMRLRVALVSPVALAIGKILQDRGNRVLFGIVRQPDAGRQRRAVLQRDQRVLDNAHGAWKRRHYHGDPQLARLQNRRGGVRILASVRHRSRITSPRGREQQISASPVAGGSSGSGSYSTLPAISAVSQVWQTPVRQDHRTGTSHASASSSRLWYFASQGKVIPLRAKETCGPKPAGSAGKCGECVSAFIPGVIE